MNLYQRITSDSHYRPLGALASLRAGAQYDAALMITREQRNQFAIFEPSLASMLRRIATAADLEPWLHDDVGCHLIAIPPDWTARLGESAPMTHLAALCPPLAAHLAAHAAGRTGPWWEVAVMAPTGPQIAWPLAAGPPAAPLAAGVVAGADVVLLADDSPIALGLLGSVIARSFLQQIATERNLPPGHPEVVAQLPIPADTTPGLDQIGDYAMQIVATTAARRAIEVAGGRRTLRDLGPAGATLGPTLTHWWTLDFIAYRSEVTRRFGGDIPERFRPEWEAWHTVQREAIAVQTATIAHLTQVLDRNVTECYGLTNEEQNALGI